MGSLSSLDVVYVALIFIVPGFLIRAVRSQFVIDQDRTGVDQFVRLLTYSTINNVLFGWITYVLVPYETARSHLVLVWTLLILVFPPLVGLASGVVAQKRISERLFQSFLFKWANIQPINTVPNAWDFKFAQAGGEWVIVVLKDDTVFRGQWIKGSFASSDPKERDIFLQDVYEEDGSHPWKNSGRSVLIAGSEIRTIEFIRN